MGSMRTAALGVLLLLQAAACAPTLQHSAAGTRDQWACEHAAEAPLGDDLDDAERRWRRELAADLSDGDGNGRVASAGDGSTSCAESGGDDAATGPPSTWDRIKSGADKAGRATFAAMSVVLTIGMMAAPYLLL